MKKIFNLLIAIHITFSSCTVSVNAKDNYMPIAEGAYNGHMYRVFDESMIWEDAKKYCDEVGGHLVTITTEEEQRFIEALLERGQKKQYWIGMRTAGGAKWITEEPYEYSNWDKGEPNNQHKENSNEDYVHIYNVKNPAVWGSERFKWNDIFGDNTYPGEEDYFSLQYVGFICEWEFVISSFCTSPSIENDYVRIACDITNGGSNDQTVNMIAALYKRDLLKNVIAKPINVPSQQTKSSSIELELPETDLEQYEIRMMVWDSLPGMSPLGSVKTEKLVSEE